MILDYDDIDKSVWLPEGEPILTPERRKMGDINTTQPCTECNGEGRYSTGEKCKKCKGKGWYGFTNAASIDDGVEIRYARAQMRNLLNYLWDQHHITDDDHTNGHLFDAWRNQHRVALGLQRANYADGAPETFGVKLRAYGYVLLISRMAKSDSDAVSQSIETMMTRHIADTLRPMPYTAAFHRLTMIMTPVRQQIDYLESLSEEEREDLSNERLAKALARR